jgi:hypothetical protein
MSGAYDLIGDRIGHTGAEGRFNHLDRRVKQFDPVTFDTPPFGSLGNRVAEEFSGQTLEVWLAEISFYEVQVLALKTRELSETECMGVG